MASGSYSKERTFVNHMIRFYLLRQRKDLTEEQVDILMCSTEYSRHFTIDIVKALVMLMTKPEIGILPHPINSDYCREQLEALRNNFTLRNFFEFSVRLMRRAVQDYVENDILAPHAAVNGLVGVIESLKRNNIISDDFLTNLHNLAVEMVEEDRRNRGISNRDN